MGNNPLRKGSITDSREHVFDWKSFDMDKFFRETDAAGEILKKNRGEEE